MAISIDRGVVTYNRLLKCMLKAIDKEDDMMLFTGDAKAEPHR